MTKLLGRSIAGAIIAALTLFSLTGCSRIPNQDSRVNLKLNVDVPGETAAATAAGGGMSIQGSRKIDPSGMVPPPDNQTFHLKISLSNPNETFMVYGYEPGAQLSLMVASGADRVLDVEAYVVPAGSVPTDFSAIHFITLNPLAERTLNLEGNAVTVTIGLGIDPAIGAVAADPPFAVPGSALTVPVNDSCPPADEFYVTLTDKDFGAFFPSVRLTLNDSEGPVPVVLTGLPLGHNFKFEFFHNDVPLSGSIETVIGPESVTALTPTFSDYQKPRVDTLASKSLIGVLPGQTIEIGLTPAGGLGGYGGLFVSTEDTCGGVISGGTYQFTVPFFIASCLVRVESSDCSGTVAPGVAVVTIDNSNPPACHDGIDNDNDGNIDYPDDPGCKSGKDDSEQESTLACDDGVDNDGWGDIDMQDPGCTSPADSSESGAGACDDGVDNDGWGDTDQADPGCLSAKDSSEYGEGACDDGVDNDGWSDIDRADPGCANSADGSELGTVECDDGVDNTSDTDTLADYSDPGCASAADASELGTAECDDGVDNASDTDILVDLNDPGCTGPADTSELGTAQCDDGIDNDGWGDVDGNDPGCTGPADNSEYNTNRACDNGSDDDGWGDIDSADPGCSSPLDMNEFGTNECDDGSDNPSDTDTLTDRNDPGCADAADTSELGTTECDDGVDNVSDGDTLVDLLDPGCASAADTSELGTAQCDDGVDNDGWGDADLMDSGCTGPDDLSEYGVGECDDGVDNDGWGDIDLADPGCASAADASEWSPTAPCDDGADDAIDSDTLADAADAGCTGPLDTDEYGTTQCDDGLDNDGWGDIDMADPGCTDPADTSEAGGGGPCDDGLDNDGWGDIDLADPGCTSASDPDENDSLVECDDGIDNDGWSDIDAADPGCSGPLDTAEINPAVACDDGMEDTMDSDMLTDASDPGCTGPTDADEFGAAECDDGLDNDGWGDIDLDDPGCTDPADASEYGVTACDDGVDNDGWSDIDAADPACVDPTYTSEYSSDPCDDGIDNDGWGDIDRGDPGCADVTDMSENDAAVECDDGVDNLDSDTLADAGDPGCTDPLDNGEESGAACDDGLDNDSWGDVDMADPGCTDPADNSEYGVAECDDGLDNDGWLDADELDPGCTDPTDASENDPAVACDDGADNDGWGDIDAADLTGCTDPTDLEESGADECDDGVDNDGWTDADVADPGCADAADTSEFGTNECDDGSDNDGWLDADASDPGCTDALDASEFGTNECDDGLDNDSDTDTVTDALDPGCADASDLSELGTVECDDGVDNDGWADLDMTDPGCTDPADASEYGTNECDDGVDNDTWGDIDLADPACLSATGTTELLGTLCDDNLDNDGDGYADSSDSCLTPQDVKENQLFFVALDGDNSDGLTWATAYNHPQTALDGAMFGDTIMVKTGTYYPIYSGDPVVWLYSGEAMFGGCDGAETTPADRVEPYGKWSVLDAQNMAPVANADSETNILLDGFELVNGEDEAVDGYGVGIISTDGPTTIRNCSIHHNLSNSFSDCTVVEAYGSSVDISNTMIHNNGCAAIYSEATATNLDNVLIDHNYSQSIGGGINLYNDGPVSVNHSTIADNSSSNGYGGGLYNYCGGAGNAVSMTNTIFYRNGADPVSMSCGSLGFTYSVVEGSSVAPGVGNMNDNPLLTNGYRLAQVASGNLADSPAVDAGSGAVTGTTRQDGVADAGAPDIGFHFPTGVPEVRVWFVNAAGTNTTGLSFADGFNSIQDAVDMALSGEQVWVMTGNYVRPIGGREPVITMKTGVDVYGGFAGFETSPAERYVWESITQLDGEGMSRHVVVMASNSRLDGFFITGGVADGNKAIDMRGGGLLAYAKTGVEVANCAFGYNSSIDYAGALYNHNSAMILENSFFEYNENGGGGGGAMVIVNSTDQYNLVRNCLFNNNYAYGMGGAIWVLDGTNIDMENITIVNNEATVAGGGIAFSNSLMTSVVNSIIYFNDADSSANVYYLDIPATITRSDVQGGYSGFGNFDLDPWFDSGPYGNYYLGNGEGWSPCVDAGSDDASVFGLDHMTTDPYDEYTDTGLVDLGFHYFVSPFGGAMPLPD